MDAETISKLYAEQCAAEPIHLMGSVQPYGFMLVVDVQSLHIVQVSAGVTRHWAGLKDASRLIGTSIEDWVEPLEVTCQRLLQDLKPGFPQNLDIALRNLDAASGNSLGTFGGDVEWDCVGHLWDYYAILEWIPLGSVRGNQWLESRHMVRVNRALSRLRNANNLPEFYEEVTQELRVLSGYDRAMLYQFLPDWSGNIISESVASGHTQKYLGLRFPASDIPPQARRLYEVNSLRALADVEAAPDELLPPLLPNGVTLDQSHCLLRSLSQAHVVYLRNMGIRATLSISILQNGKLWGMLVCHHHTSRVPPHHVRETLRNSCELIGIVVAMRLQDLEKIRSSEKALELSRVNNQMIQAMQQEGNLLRGLSDHAQDLCKAFGASDFGFCAGALRFFSGEQTDPVRRELVLAEMDARSADMAPSECKQELNLLTPQGRPLKTVPSAYGLLLVRLPRGQDGYFFFIRHEVVETVHWAGEPQKFVTQDAADGVRLEPRNSFALWKEQVRGTAAQWDETELKAASRLADLLADTVTSHINFDLQRQLHWRAHHDHLTGLNNRAVAESELTRRLAAGSGLVGLCLMDMDHFKRINDTLGHATGDQVLRILSERIASVTRGNDLVARIGGDEFMLITELKQPVAEQARAIAQRIHDALEVPFQVDSHTLKISISVGVAYSPDHGVDAVTLMRHADMALYEAKGLGRDQSAVFDMSLEQRMVEDVQLETQLRDAIDGGQLRLHYQPKVASGARPDRPRQIH